MEEAVFIISLSHGVCLWDLCYKSVRLNGSAVSTAGVTDTLTAKLKLLHAATQEQSCSFPLYLSTDVNSIKKSN